MTDCRNEELRDLLPLLAHGSLPEGEGARVRAHLRECPSCASELATLETVRTVLRAAAPRVDAAAVGRALADTGGTPVLTVVPGEASQRLAGRRRAFWVPRYYVAAAASLLIVTSLSMPLLKGIFGGGPEFASPDGAQIAGPAGHAGTGVGLSVAGGLEDLSSDDLSTLLAELESVEATVVVEPTALRQPIVDSPEGQ